MNNTVTVDSINGDDNIDNISFDDAENQTIDLTEVIHYDKQNKVKTMVSGVEHYIKTGIVTQALADFYNVPMPSNKADPTGGTYNSRFGGEGFFTTVMDGLEKGIVAVIRFIKKIVLWCVDKVKFIFGFGPSDRQAEVIATELPKLKEELAGYLTALGFPGHLMDINYYLEDLPTNQRRIPQLKFLTSKLVNEKEALTELTEVIPLADKVLHSIGRSSRAATTAKQRVSKHIQTILRNNSRVNYLDSDLAGLQTDMLEVIKAFNIPEIVSALKEMLAKSAGIKVTEETLQNNFVTINEQLTASIKTAQVLADSAFVDKINQLIGFSATRDMKTGEQNQIRGFLKELYDLTDASELTKVRAITEATGNNDYLVTYQQMAAVVNQFTNFANMTLTIVKNTRNTLKDLTGWYDDALRFMFAGLANDVKVIKELMLKAKATNPNFNVPLSATGLPTKMVFMQEADAQTVMEKISTTTHQLIEVNVLGAQDALNKIGSRLGFGKLA